MIMIKVLLLLVGTVVEGEKISVVKFRVVEDLMEIRITGGATTRIFLMFISIIYKMYISNSV